jgi:hypothetical protein
MARLATFAGMLGGYIPYSSVHEQQSDKISIQSAEWQLSASSSASGPACGIVWCQDWAKLSQIGQS